MTWWRKSVPVDPVGLAEAIDTVKARLADDGTLRKNIRVILGWLQDEKVRTIADSPRLEMSMEAASRLDAYERGMARGIEEAILVTDPEQLREVRDWLNEQATEQGDEQA